MNTNQHTYLIIQSFALIQAHADEIIPGVYQDLTEHSPHLHNIFKNAHMPTQYHMFLDQLRHIVQSLSFANNMGIDASRMIQRHVDYVPSAHYYELMGDIFVKHVRRVLGNTISETCLNAWLMFFQDLADMHRDNQASAG